MSSLHNPIRFITAASLFDGHDATIHIIRRILQSEGAEVIHLGHNRSVQEIVTAAIQEDAQGIAVSSYQGGHVEYFTYLLDLLKEKGASHIKVFGGGGGVIVPEEIELLHKRGVSRIFSPDDGFELGLVGMIQHMLKSCESVSSQAITSFPKQIKASDWNTIARVLTTLELDVAAQLLKQEIAELAKTQQRAPIIGITGTGGAGKSSLIDELLLRFLEAFPDKSVAVLSVDPTSRRTGGALLGDRIRFNSLRSQRIFMRSMATRRPNLATSAAVKDAVLALALCHFDLVILETAGIGQSDSEVTQVADLSVYVMTPEYGAQSQLDKIDMLDYADLVVINKFDKRGAWDALRDVRKVVQRNRKQFMVDPAEMPVFGASAHRFNDLGTNKFFNALFNKLGWEFTPLTEGDPDTTCIIPPQRTQYLGNIAQELANYHQQTDEQLAIANQLEDCWSALKQIGDAIEPLSAVELDGCDDTRKQLRARYNTLLTQLTPSSKVSIEQLPGEIARYQDPAYTFDVRGKTIEIANFSESLSKLQIPKIAVPPVKRWADRIEFRRRENLPGHFPYTAGVYPFKRKNEDPTRMFAGEGTAERTNKRFHYVSLGQPAVRLSTAFDSVTLYGADPALRPDIYGKVGNSGVSICSLDDAKRLYSGFDLCAPSTSVSMTINGPAPTILAFFFNAAIDAEIERTLKQDGQWDAVDSQIKEWFAKRNLTRPVYRADKLPEGHNGNGLGFLGIPSSFVVDLDLYKRVSADVLRRVRGTVQADILKEDQAQNTCIFSTEYAMRMMGDVQQYFIDHQVRNFYSVSISGYHIAEAGANPITQLAFTLSNGFTIVEYYRARGMKVDDFAPNLSFFFSNGLDPEYSVIGRVARRIWAVAMRDIYGGNARSQMLKYHVQTSGRSLHAQEIAFNDIRTTLQALYAITDNCNSLHTNAYDEAVTTPTEESVRRAIAIQMIINQELGMTKNENPLQGSYFIEALTDLVEKAVLQEFRSLDLRGGVLGAMETMYQRSKIQEESLYYEHKKMSGELPIIGVNCYQPEHPSSESKRPPALIRSTDAEKDEQVEQVAAVHRQFDGLRQEALLQLKRVATSGENTFAQLMECAKICTLGEISDALYEVGGAYRRNM